MAPSWSSEHLDRATITTYLWVAIVVTCSLVVWVGGDAVADALCLAPTRIWRGELWRLVTWVLAERSVFSLVMTAAIARGTLGILVEDWGVGRALAFAFGVAAIAAVVTCVVALAAPTVMASAHLGGLPVRLALIVALGRARPTDPIVHTMTGLQLHGRGYALVTTAFIGLLALGFGPATMVPDLAALAVAWLLPIRARSVAA